MARFLKIYTGGVERRDGRFVACRASCVYVFNGRLGDLPVCMIAL